MKLTVNGEAHIHPGDGTLAAVVEELGANPAHAAVMRNGDVVPSEAWANTALHENDKIEMLVFVGGG